jgi:uncharacterized membrane protein
VEELLQRIVADLVTLVEACGAAVIIVGAVWGFVRFVVAAVMRRDTAAFVPVRLTLGRFLALGLEFQLASDVLRTAVAPSYREIGQLAAVAAIRTALNYFLSKEISEERKEVAHDGGAGAPASTTAAATPPGASATVRGVDGSAPLVQEPRNQ